MRAMLTYHVPLIETHPIWQFVWRWAKRGWIWLSH
jgi:hypothetical protein